MNRAEQLDGDADTMRLSTSQLRTSPASSQVKVEIAGATHTGHVRKNNEDHFLAVRLQRSLSTITTNIGELELEKNFEEVGYGLLVADGMGGMAAGEVASRMALCKLVELAVNTPDWIMNFNQQSDEAKVMQRLTQRFRQIDEALRDAEVIAAAAASAVDGQWHKVPAIGGVTFGHPSAVVPTDV